MLFASGLSDTGCKRHTNQDRIFVDVQSSTFVLADGMGGENCGGLAAEIAVETVAAALSAPSQAEPSSRMADAIQLANRRIRERSKEVPGCDGMGSTICAVSLMARTVTV